MASERSGSQTATASTPHSPPSPGPFLTPPPPPVHSNTQSPELQCLPNSPLRTALLNFSSQWFLIPQGAGITTVVLHQLDYQFPGLQIISYCIWAFAVACLVLMPLIYLARIIMFPKHVAMALTTGVVEVACLSSLCIAFTSAIQMLAVTLGDEADRRWGMLACVLWWINMALALAVSTIIPYLCARVHPPGIDSLPPVVLLPMVAAITLAAGGGVVAQSAGLGVTLTVPIVLVSYLFLGLAVPLALAFTTVYLARLVDRSPPPRDKVFQDMILCGPWGQGSFALQSLGQVVAQNTETFAGYSAGMLFTVQAWDVAGYASMFLGFVLWAQAVFWWFFASASVVQSWSRVLRKNMRRGGKLQYTLGGWSLVFPWVSIVLPSYQASYADLIPLLVRASLPMPR